jgi:hypothetical protein
MSDDSETVKNDNMKKNTTVILGVLILLCLLYLLYSYFTNPTSIAYDSSLGGPSMFGSRPPDVSQLFNNLCE